MADLAVAGAGAFGLMLSAVASQAAPGLRVTVLERDLGATTNAELGSGSVIAAGTRMQLAAGVHDDPALMARDILAQSGGTDEARVRRLCEASRHMVHWLADEVGAELELATEARRAGHARLRLHAVRERSGAPLIAALRAYVARLPGVQILDDSPVVGLATRGGRVTGVVVDGPDGRRTIAAGAVALGCGGFGANPTLVRRYLPAGAAGAPYVGSDTHLGDAVIWGGEIGAAVVEMGSYLGQGYVLERASSGPCRSARLNPGVVTAGAIIVNLAGRRFAREDRGYSAWASSALRGNGGAMLAIWDEHIHRRYRQSRTMQDALALDAIASADSIDDLGAATGVPAGALAETLGDYNAGFERGSDRLGRALTGRPLRAPYRAARIRSAVLQSLGGLHVDRVGRVQRPDGSPIEGLYAGGAAAAGLSGGSADGYLSGSGLLTAFGAGFVLGRALARKPVDG